MATTTPISTPAASGDNPVAAANGADQFCIAAAADTPASAKSEPTERSMPPAMITKVIPSAMMPLYETCREMLSKFEAEKNTLLVREHTSINVASAKYGPEIAEAAFFSFAVVNCMLFDSSGKVHYFFFSEFIALEFSREFATAHDECARAVANDFFEVG